MNQLLTRGIVIFAALTLMTSCTQPLSTREKGALAGGGLGAATGAIVGSATGNPGAGAAIGGALGGVTGGLVGDQLKKQEHTAAQQQREIEKQQKELAQNRELLEKLKRRDLQAHETERGVVVNLPNVLFKFGSAELTPQADEKVRNIANVIEDETRNRQIAVEGHTDSIGSEAFNQRLSERRAEAVAKALQIAGVSRSRITARGFGERYPIAPNTTTTGADNPAGRAKNRRVEVIIEN